MAELGFEHNVTDAEPLKDFEPIPAGKYEAMIVESERKLTNAGDGELLNLQWQIVSGEYEGRRVFDRVNLANPNPQAVQIGRSQLSSILAAVGVGRVSDSSELHDRPCEINVKVRPAGNDKKNVYREAQNEVKGYKPLQGSAPAASVAKTTTTTAPRPVATAAAPAAPAKKPWERK